jgi:serine phosphatase RsbU (regulator of sigma subunit)
MATARALLRVALLETTPGQGPADVFDRLAIWFPPQFESDQYVTMWLGIWDQEAETLRVASSAHPPPVLWRLDGEPEFLESEPTLPLGLAGIEPIRAEEICIEFNVGDRLFLYTDAWIESRATDGRVLSGDSFLDFIGNAYGQSTQMAVKMLFMEFERFAANSRITDDVSLFVVDRIE